MIRGITDTLCLHCVRRVASRARHLCARCYESLEIRHQYPAGKRGGRYDTVIFAEPPARTPPPTLAIPGSPEKLEVLCGRADRHEALFHRLDAKIEE